MFNLFLLSLSSGFGFISSVVIVHGRLRFVYYEMEGMTKKTNAAFEKQQADEDETIDSIKALENRVEESQREMAELDALEEIRAMNQRHAGLMKGGGRWMLPRQC
mmetsp:Transcript_37261/g.68465  ORF Transcript_37261/g.68465 Transcript_37261/m.68465 type:complete len:105 (+) Transcript_37261:271-585(+)